MLGRFADYVRGSGGVISASDGAIVDETGMPSWPLASADEFADGAGVLRFAGTVRYSAHFGALDLPLADPVIRLDGDRGRLHIPVPGAADAQVLLAEFAWAEAPATGAVRGWVGREVSLSAEAVPLFGGSYPAGMPLDPLIVILDVSQ